MDGWIDGQMDAWRGQIGWNTMERDAMDRTDRQMKEINGPPYEIMVLIIRT